MNKTILITGYKGFVGRNLTNYFKKKNKIYFIDNNLKKLNKFNNTKVDVIIHLLHKIEKNNEIQNYEDFKINYFNLKLLLAFAVKKKSKIIYLSTYMYGLKPKIPIDESHEIQIENSYQLSKKIIENILETYSYIFKLKITVFRVFNLYGKFQSSRYFFPSTINSIKKNKIINVYKNSSRDYLHVMDLCSVIEKAIEYKKRFDIFNIGNGKMHSNLKIVYMISNIINKKALIKIKKDKKNTNRTKANINKALYFLKWKPKISIENGIKSLLNE